MHCESRAFGCPSLTAKGRRNRLTAICQLPAHQRTNSGQLFIGRKLLRLRLRFSTVYLPIALALIIGAQFARANETLTATQAKSAQACGTTIEDNVSAARKALQSNDKTTRAALACLIDAVSALNAEKCEAVRSDGTTVLTVPHTSDAAR
jgi:hypothetical protein